MSSPINGFGPSSYEKQQKKPPILCLPPETLNAIFSYASSLDLVNLSLVSKPFHDLAAAQLYRSLSHVFDERDPTTGQLTLDRLTRVLDTLAISDYNYAAYIKEISLDTVQNNRIDANVASEFQYGSSSGRFLNTLLLGTIKKIVALESFRWNVRVELSPAIFATLGKHTSLQNVHVRLQDGLPTYPSSPMPPLSGPLSFGAPAAASMPPTTNHYHHHGHHHYHHHQPPPPSSSAQNFLANADVKLRKRLNIQKLPHTTRNFSRFSRLKSFAVLDMDTLDYVPEIAECISSSSTTLKTLKLSFSDTLALKARKKAVDPSDADTVQEDDDDGFVNGPLMASPAPPPPPVASQPLFGNHPATNDAGVRLERAAQAKALAQIFGLEKRTAIQQNLEKIADRVISNADKEIQEALGPLQRDVDRMFVEKLSAIVHKLEQSKGASWGSNISLKALQNIERAAAIYLERYETTDVYRKGKKKPFTGQKHSHKAPLAQIPGTQKQGPLFGTSAPLSQTTWGFNQGIHSMKHSGLVYPQSSQFPPSNKSIFYPSQGSYPPGSSLPAPGSMHKSNAVLPGKPANDWKPTGKAFADYSSSPSDAGESIFSKFPESMQNKDPQQPSTLEPEEKEFEDELQDMVDMEHPDEVNNEDGEDQEFIDSGESSAQDEDLVPFLHEKPKLSQSNSFSSHADGDASGESCKGKKPIRASGDSWHTGSPTSILHQETGAMEDTDDAIQAYIRLHHGIPVESLSIYLIPVKPSILCRAVNLSALKHLCLLNVGPQRPFWAMLTKLHKTTPLQLTSIHTDNVTPSFLAFLNGLNYLEELFMVERSNRSKVESFAPKTEVVIEDIKKQVLAKHVTHLKRLMIRNDNDSSWDLDKGSVLLIGRRGLAIKELVVALDSPNFHVLMLNMHGLRSLRVLHILFSQNDSCLGMLREIRLCAIDIVIQSPHLKVEYVAVSYAVKEPRANSVSRLEYHPACSSSPSKIGSKNMHSLYDEDADEDRNGVGNGFGHLPSSIARHASSSLKGKEKEVHFPWESEEEHSYDDDYEDYEDDGVEEGSHGDVTVHDGLKFHDVTGIKVWQKEIWDLKL
ncbi:hypothetical protein ACJ73_08342 [Blastomyces percursus]|uniref:F-box domain-containing protein n=1 Tax=Blastomyces percursus TaxID=1658174 RepID=A0A1J9QWU8_9EURO|nr:hypothetical protein ACJ73_08342 [Blastomyces percursus]